MKYILIVLLLSSCGSAWHLKQAKRHEMIAISKGAKISIDTVYKQIEVIRPERHIDTVLTRVDFRDTITVTQDKIVTRLKIDTITKEIYIHTDCPKDTIRIRVPFAVNKEIKSGFTGMQLIGVSLFWLMLAILAVIFVRGSK